jgi:hypothetical protein
MLRPVTHWDPLTTRTWAYGRVVRAVAGIPGAALAADEAGLLREACDALIFDDPDAARLLAAATDLLRAARADGRLPRRVADRLLADVEACADEALFSVPA